MSSDLLSQDEIDSLMSGDGGDDSGFGETAESSSAGAEISAENLSPVIDVITEQASTVLVTVLGKEISINTASILPATQDSLAIFSEDSILIKLNFSGNVNGIGYFVYTKKDVAILADLMMMGDGTADYEEDHKDAIVELTNQIMGAVTTSLSSKYDCEVSIDQPVATDFDITNVELDIENSQFADCKMNIEDITDTSFGIMLQNDTAQGFVTISNVNAGGTTIDGLDDAGIDLDGLGGLDELSDGGGGMQLQNFSQPSGSIANDKSSNFSSTGNPQIDMLLDVTLQVSIELGRTNMSIKKILELGPGSIIELDRMAGEPVDLLVNDKIVAKGEVVVIEENFGIRIVKLVSPEERLKSLR